MTTTDTQKPDHGAPKLLAELEAAERTFNEVVGVVGRATDFLICHKGSLNEQQFGQKLEAASSDTTRAQEVIAAQNRLRTSYMSSRLALFCTFSRLVRARDKFVRTVMKIAATLPALKKDSPAEFDLLSTRTLEAVWRCNKAYESAGQRREKEWERDLTDGQAGEALRKAFEQLVNSGVNNHVPQYQDPVLFLIPLTSADLHEYRFCDAELNDQVVTAGNTAWNMMFSEEFRLVWNMYHAHKGALNEPQYRSRLARYVENKNQSGIDVVKGQQQYARFQYLGSRASVTEHHRKFAEVVDQLAALNEQLKEKLKDDAHVGANYKLAVMNNIIAADAIIRRVKAQQAKWAEELAATTEVAEVSATSTIERLAAEIGKEPYRGLSWIYRGDGTYIEPL